MEQKLIDYIKANKHKKCLMLDMTEEEWDELLKLIDKPCGKKCGDCKYLNLNDRTSIGYLCEHPDRPYSLRDANHIKRFGYSIAARVYTSKKACKRWEQR